MLKTRRNRVLVAIIAVLLVLLGMLATTAFSRKVLDPSIFALGSDKMPGIGDYVSLGDLEVRVDEVDKEDQAEAEKTTAGYRTVLGRAAVEAVTGCLAEPAASSGDDGDSGGEGTVTTGATDLVIMKVTFRNNGDAPIDFRRTTPPTMDLQTVGGTRATPACGTLIEAGPEDQVVEPGGAMPGMAAYRIPAGDDPGWVRWADPATGETATTDVGGGEDAPGTCEAADLDLSETEFGAYLAALELPLADSGFTHLSNLRVVNNQFDPCAELSWVTVTGTPMRDTRGDPYDDERTAVVFFTGEHLADFDMSVYREIGEVRRTAPDEVTLSYNAYLNRPDPFVTVPYSTAGASDPDEPPRENGRIDFAPESLPDVSGPGTRVPIPFGNVHTAEPLTEIWLGMDNRTVRIEAGGFPVTCIFATDPVVNCHRDSGTWSFPDGTEGDAASAIFTEVSTAITDSPRIELKPGVAPAERNIGHPHVIPPGSRVLVDSVYVVDTTDGTVRMFFATRDNARELRIDEAQVQDLPLDNAENPYGLDTSRWA